MRAPEITVPPEIMEIARLVAADPGKHATQDPIFFVEAQSEQCPVGECPDLNERVDAYMTESAANARADGENKRGAGTYSVYVGSAHRNHEWRALRKFLLAIAGLDGEQ